MLKQHKKAHLHRTRLLSVLIGSGFNLRYSKQSRITDSSGLNDSRGKSGKQFFDSIQIRRWLAAAHVNIR